MAYEISNNSLKVTLIAGADLSAKQYFFVKMSADNTCVLCSGATDVPIGVLQNSPISGGEASVTVIGGTKLVASAAIAAGVKIGTASMRVKPMQKLLELTQPSTQSVKFFSPQAEMPKFLQQ
jgi:hypothetical protein